MKNSEFINYVEVTDSFENIRDYFKDIHNIDNSVFNIKKYYSSFYDKLLFKDDLFNTLCQLMKENYDSKIERLIYKIIEFCIYTIQDQHIISDILVEIAYYLDKEGKGCFNNIEVNTQPIIMIDEVEMAVGVKYSDNGRIIDLYDKDSNILYENVLGLEKDLKNDSVHIIYSSGDKEKDKDLLKIEADKLKIIF